MQLYHSLETFETMGFCTNSNLTGIMTLEKTNIYDNEYYILDVENKRLKKVDFGFKSEEYKKQDMTINYKLNQVKEIK